MNNLESQFVEAMWSALTEDPDFMPMLSAWDDMFAKSSLELDGESLVKDLERDLTRLEAAFTASIQTHKNNLNTSIERQEPCLHLDPNNALQYQSPRFAALGLCPLYLEVQLKEIDLNSSDTQFIWGQSQVSQNRYLLAVTPIDLLCQEPRKFLVKLIGNDWDDQFDQVLLNLFPLTNAELAVLKELYQGRDSVEIARNRQRSVHTVRVQVKSILDKCGVNNQRLLIRLLSSAFHLYEKNQTRSAQPSDVVRKVIRLENEQYLEYCDYGPEMGRPIFLISPTVSPEPGAGLQKLVNKYKLRIIAPFRPGSGKSTKKAFKFSPKLIANDYLKLIEKLNLENPAIVGYASGGLYAIATANLLKDKCAGLMTIDTGYPLRNMTDIMRMPSAARRTFLAARISPKLLYAPHRIAANDFLSSPAGERRLVEYFFENQPHDLNRVKTDDYFFRAIRNVIKYSFENIERLVDDVSYWSQNWEDSTKGLDSRLKKIAIIGEQNLMFKPQDMARWCANNDWACHVIEDEGQLLAFSQPEKILSIACKQIFDD